MENETQIELKLLLPDVDASDECVSLLTTQLSQQKGIEQAHIVRENGNAKLCLHYDPNLTSLSTLERIAHEAGAEISERYRHEQLPFSRLNTADAALSLEKELNGLNGMLHASVNYAAGLIFVAYDNTILERSAIDTAIRGMGAKIVQPIAKPQVHAEHDHKEDHEHDDHEAGREQGHGHDHGSAPAFLIAPRLTSINAPITQSTFRETSCGKYSPANIPTIFSFE